jgi:hypothetical protein
MTSYVYWQGIREDLVCEDREEAMKMLRELQRKEHGVEALELVAIEEKIELGVRSTRLRRGRWCAAGRPDLTGLSPARRYHRPSRRCSDVAMR